MSGTKVLECLLAMKRNPRNGWTIEDVTFLCRGLRLQCESSENDSNYVVSHSLIDGSLTIPARRPIKPIYIMLLVQLAETALEIE